MIPSVISGWPNSAVSEATIMSHSSASSQPPPSAKPETAAISGVRQSATRCQNGIVDASSTSWKERSAIALMSAPAANTSSLPAITMQRTPLVARRGRSIAVRELLHHRGRERVAPLRPVRARTTPTASYALDLDGCHRPYSGISALMPVAWRPMISFWICEVPSYRVVTRASRM